MKIRATWVALASVLAMACSGSDNNTAGAGGGAVAGPQPNQPTANASGSKVGTDPPPPNAEGNVASPESDAPSSTDLAPRTADQVPADGTDPFPGQGSGGTPFGGDCHSFCHALAGQCAAVSGSGETGDIQEGCVQPCEAAMGAGCDTQFAAMFGCVVTQFCLAGTTEVDGDLLLNACRNVAMGLYACDADLTEDLFGDGGGMMGPPMQMPVDNPSVDPTIQTQCEQACTGAMSIPGCAPSNCVSTCVTNPQAFVADLQECVLNAGMQ